MKKKKILVVDDQQIILEFMKDLLEEQGHQVLTAQDGLSAMDVLHTDIPDVMFVDLIMPNLNGEKLCQIVRMIPRLKDLYIIILSGVAAEQGVNVAESGANAFIAKGPRDKMAHHVLAALNKSDLEDSGSVKEEIVGLEDICPRDITRNLLSIKRHFEVILGSMSDGILEITPEARIVYANTSAISLIGMTEEKLLGSNFIELFSKNDHQRTQRFLDAAIGDEREITGGDAPVTLNSRHVLLDILPVKDKEVRYIIILNDVTDRILMETQLREAHKMEAIGTLSGGVAHGFNNLLMGIQGNVSLMLMDMDSTHPYHERLENIERQIQSGAKLASQLLGYARKGRYEVKSIDLNQLMEGISDTFGTTKKDITIRRTFAGNLFPIEADQGQIEQVLWNLFANAVDAMSGGGDLILKTMNVTHKDMKGKIYDPRPGKYLLLTVTDTGIGMDKETMERIFDPFYTTKEIGRGHGLGLASAYGIIKGHGGYIDVESKQGEGTTFSVYLPASKKKVREAVKTAEPFIKGTGTVLLVDDEEVILEVGKELLEAMGYRVLKAKGGKDAVEVYKKNRDCIDIVLLDMVMTDMGGGEAFDLMKKIDPDIKVLLSSGFSIDGEATEILERGCNGFIQKPFRINELSEKIREIQTPHSP